ncbi:MAG TPA: hypothetical protein VGD18_00370, partial [Thiobacillaceae bacterium]
MADQYLRAGLRGSPFESSDWTPAQREPLPLTAPACRVGRILRAGRYRFFRALMLGAPLPSLVTVAGASALVAAVWIRGWDWADVYAAGRWALAELLTYDAVIDWVRRIELKHVAAGGLVALLAWIAVGATRANRVWETARYKLLSERSGAWRRVLTGWKNLKRYRGNLLWLFKLLPLAVFAVSAAAWIGHGLFAKPFQWKTRDPAGLDR